MEPAKESPLRRWSRLKADLACRHDMLAYLCGVRESNGRKTCNPGAFWDAVTRNGKTAKEVVEERIACEDITRAEAETMIRGELRWRKVKNVSKVAGVIVGMTALVTVTTLTIRFIRGKSEDDPPSSAP